MAKIQKELYGNFDMILNAIDSAVMDGSMSASLEDSSDFYAQNSRCSVRVYERYSYWGKNRVSLSITLYETSGHIFISAIAAGGSQALFFKINTFGERAFLDTIEKTVDAFSYKY